jgi:hypothetical protein
LFQTYYLKQEAFYTTCIQLFSYHQLLHLHILTKHLISASFSPNQHIIIYQHMDMIRTFNLCLLWSMLSLIT